MKKIHGSAWKIINYRSLCMYVRVTRKKRNQIEWLLQAIHPLSHSSFNVTVSHPQGAHTFGADLSIVSTWNLSVQIDVANFSVALFASQITRLSYAKSSLISSVISRALSALSGNSVCASMPFENSKREQMFHFPFVPPYVPRICR